MKISSEQNQRIEITLLFVGVTGLTHFMNVTNNNTRFKLETSSLMTKSQLNPNHCNSALGTNPNVLSLE